MKVTLVLCDFAAASEGKLSLIGGGWNFTGPAPSTFGIAVLIEVPWNQTNERHRWKLWLETEDGEALRLPGPMGEQAVEVSEEFEVGRPPGVPPGSSINIPLAFNFQGLPLPPGARFEWRFSIDDYGEDHWRVAFNTRPAASQQSGPRLGTEAPES